MVRTNWPGVMRIRAGNQDYLYLRRRVGGKIRLIRLPDDPRSPEFAERYKILTEPDGEGRKAAPFSFHTLIASYRGSTAFSELAPRTRHDYRRHLDMIGGWLGSKDASRYPRPEILRMLAANAHRPRTANYLLSLMVVLMNHAMDLGWRTDNPAKGVRKLKTGPGYAPWSAEQIEAFRAANAEKPEALMVFELALGTGQRPGDLTRMRWADYDGSGIDLIQGKTGARLYAPVTARLKAMLDAARPSGQEHEERPILGTSAYAGMEMRFRRARARAGLAAGVSLHGLRKNATIELAEAGCTEAEIKAITGHETSEMIALYSKGANQRRVAKAARLKTEAARLKAEVFDREQNEIGKMSGKTCPTTADR